MTSPTPPKPTAIPAIIVFGTPTSPELTQASWFRAEDMREAKAAAEALKFSVIELKTETDKALTVGVHEGVLKGSGRMIVASVTTEVYRRIEEYARKASGGDASLGAPAPQIAATKSATEQNKNKSVASEAGSPPVPSGKATPVSPTEAWQKLKAGDRVLAAYWNLEKEPEGWWPAVVARVEKSEIVLNWPDAPHYPAIKRKPRHVAILHPEFIASGE